MATPADYTSPSLDAYEQAFASGLRHSSRGLQQEPWVAGVAHVFTDVPPQPEPIVSAGVNMFQLLLVHQDVEAREQLDGRAPHINGTIAAGNLNLYTPPIARERSLTSWTTQRHDSTGLMLSHATLAAVAADLERDYASIEFVEGYNITDPLLAAVARAVRHELVAGAPGGRMYAEQLLYTAAAHLIHRYSARGAAPVARTGGLPPRALQRARDYAAVHLSNAELGLSDLASAAGYSPWHFARALRTSTGETPAQLVWRLRTDEAARLLRANPRPTVAAVARAVGYTSAAGFSRAFKRRWGVGPGQWGK